MRIVAIVALVGLSTAIPAADPWSRYGGPNGDFRAAAVTPTPGASPEWKRSLGVGASGVVTDGRWLFTMYARSHVGNSSAEEVTIALDATIGQTVWEQANPVSLLPKQETFGGALIQPQATPAVADGRIFTLGFAGLLQAREAATGKRIWSHDLATEYDAKPVQFGFAASPILHDGKLIVAVGGQHAVLAFDPKSGEVVWKSESAEPAYATPVVMTLDHITFIVQLTRDALLGIDATTGQTLWTFPLPKKGLTNVPTPIVLSNGRILISGQGCDGTRMLKLVRTDATITVQELWHQRKAQFFYSNWATDGTAVYGFPGNAGKRFSGMNLSDGSIRFQELGQTDANVVLLEQELLLCRGDGVISRAKATAEGLDVLSRGQPIAGRCWTPPTVLGDTVIVRTTTQLARVRLASLNGDFKPPADSGVSALDAAFAPKPKK